MKRVTLSIITVNYNNNTGLIQTLESIKKQTFSSYEHIIIDANSTDGSKDTIKKYAKENIHLSYWISEPDKGIYDGMNKGIEHANGEYLYFLNSGDCLIENILQKIPFDGTEYIYADQYHRLLFVYGPCRPLYITDRFIRCQRDDFGSAYHIDWQSDASCGDRMEQAASGPFETEGRRSGDCGEQQVGISC